MRKALTLIVAALFCSCHQGDTSLPGGDSANWTDRPCVEIPVPTGFLGEDWMLSVNATSEAPGQHPVITTDHTRGPVCQAEIAILLKEAQLHQVLKGCNFGYAKRKGESENWIGDLSTNAMVFASSEGAEGFFRQRIATWDWSPAGEIVDDLGDSGWLFRSSVSRAFFCRGAVYVEIESILDFDDVEHLARLLDKRIAGQLSPEPAGDH